MLSKKTVKDIQSLIDKKARDEQRLFVAEGPKIVAELLAEAPQQVRHIYALEVWAKANEVLLKGVSFEIIDEVDLKRISLLQTPNQVLAVMQQFPALKPEVNESWVLYLDAIQDPGNMGTIIRLADWFAVPHIVCTEGCADVYNPKVVQSTMASLARVNIWQDRSGDWLQQKQVPIYAAALDGISIYNSSKMERGILIIGNESKGVRKEFLELATEKLTIPRLGGAESLNAAVATGIILSHIT